MVTAGQLLQIWSHRLGMNTQGITQWSSALRADVEKLVANLKTIEATEAIELDANMDRDPIARFIRASTGEILGEIHQPADFPLDREI